MVSAVCFRKRVNAWAQLRRVAGSGAAAQLGTPQEAWAEDGTRPPSLRPGLRPGLERPRQGRASLTDTALGLLTYSVVSAHMRG